MKKKCSYCKKEKELSEFGGCKENPDGLRYDCKECSNKYAKARVKSKRDENNNFLNTFL